jgi:methyl-accepting chemotaxis protein
LNSQAALLKSSRSGLQSNSSTVKENSEQINSILATVASSNISQYTENIKNSVDDFIQSLLTINNSINENSETVTTLSSISNELNKSSEILAEYVKRLSEDK